jgi:hypothetical protein
VAGIRRRFVRDPFHQAAVTCNEPGVVIDQRVAVAVEGGGEMCLGGCHADGVGHALSQRAGGGFDARRVAVLRVPRRLAPPLAELLEFIEREVVAREMQYRIQQHRRVAIREHEAIAIGPRRIGGVVPHVSREERIRQRCQSHRRAGVAALGLLHGIHGERADGVDAERVER